MDSGVESETPPKKQKQGKDGKHRNRGGRGRGARGGEKTDAKRFTENKTAQEHLSNQLESKINIIGDVTVPSWIVDGVIPVVATGFAGFFSDYLAFLRSIARRPLIDYLNGDLHEHRMARAHVFRALLTVFDLRVQLAQRAAPTKRPQFQFPFTTDIINNICDRVVRFPAPFQTALGQIGNVVISGQTLTPVYGRYVDDNIGGLCVGSSHSIRIWIQRFGRNLNAQMRQTIDSLTYVGYPLLEYFLVIDQPARDGVPAHDGVPAVQSSRAVTHYEVTQETRAFWGTGNYVADLDALCDFVTKLNAQNPKLVATFPVHETAGYLSQLVRIPEVPGDLELNAEAYATIEIPQSMLGIAGATRLGYESFQNHESWIQTGISRAPYRYSIPLFACRRALIDTVAP